ncbi:MFS transporter [Arthrobacter sp. CAN_C5]|uniref:MFS transporter n=1 Tax=Arthrobacter sp. CAN_C5 TaxID=2760706 RepID=UPI001AE45A0B|nr:MFS transporter [Arthrobacter sp. CAN_C5]MBP2216718.1 MFS family permease [Arthrobacter sp. CAN_C5]
MLEVLRVTAYRRLFTAQVVALAGTGLLTVALGLLAYDLAGARAGTVLGTALTIKMLAYVFVAPVMAVLVERVPRKAVLIGADLMRTGIALTLPLVDQVWQIYLLVFILQSASATFTPAFQALIPTLLPRERDYTRALSLSRLAYDLESVLSPILAAALLTFMSFHLLFVGTAVGFLLSAAMVVATPLPPQQITVQRASVLHRTTLGTRIFLGEPTLRGLMALNFVVACGTALVLVNTVVYALELFEGTNTDLAIALACYGAGSMAVALTVPPLLDRVTDRTLMIAGGGVISLGLGLAGVLAAAGQSWVLLLAVWTVLGAGTSMINTPSARLLRRAATSASRAPLFTAQFSLSHACFILTYPIAGWLGATLGQEATAGILAGLATLGVLAALKLWPRGWSPVSGETATVQEAHQ